MDSEKVACFFDSLYKEDRLLLLKMILEMCSYNEDISSMIKMENSESYSDLMFFLVTMKFQQKKINRSKTSDKEKKIGHF